MEIESIEQVDTVEDGAAATKKPRWRRSLVVVFRFAVVIGILVYLVASRSLEFHKFSTMLHGWHWALASFLMLLPGFLLASWRYQLLLGALGLRCTFFQALSWNMIGSFFDVAMPSASGGDVVKAWYVVKHVGPGNRSLGVLSVLLDRIIGLFALILLAPIVCLFAGTALSSNAELAKLAQAALAVSVLSILAFVLFSSETLETSSLRQRMMHWLPYHDRIERIYTSFSGLRHHKGTLLTVLALSLVNHLMGCAAILVLAKSLVFTSTVTGAVQSLEIVPTLVVLPLGLLMNMFGVAGGFGGGELAFEKLFSIVLKTNGGAELAFAFHVVAILTRVFGIPFVVHSRHESHPTESAPAPSSAGGA